MINIATSPELKIGSLDLIISLSVQLSDKKEFAAMCIKNAIADNVPSDKIISTVKDMIRDNPVLMNNLLGELLTNKISKS